MLNLDIDQFDSILRSHLRSPLKHLTGDFFAAHFDYQIGYKAHHRVSDSDTVTAGDILAAKALHPGAEVWVHPECPLDVIDLADKVLSTGKMILEARTTSRREVIIGTEKGILYRLGRENPAVKFYPGRAAALCVHMKMTTLAKVLRALETDTTRVVVPPAVADRARGAIQAMLQIS